ncbi:MAG TPA: FmdB family zinc ribbon protein [Micromonosporaceae bacterium]
MALDDTECQQFLILEASVPTYQYACTACGHQLEAVQSFSDAALTVCPACDGSLRKVFSAVGIVFKGSGFYRTDSRSSSSSSTVAPAQKESTSTSASSSSSSSDSGSSSSSTSSSSTSSTSSTPAASSTS